MLEKPRERAVLGPQRESGGGVERLIIGAANGTHPGLGLRGAPVGEVEFGIIAAGDPTVAAGTQQVRKLAPGFTARGAFARDGLEFPELLSSRGVIGADEAAGFLVAIAAAHALNHLAL